MKTRNVFGLFFINCLVLALSLTAIAQVLPTEMDTTAAQQINGKAETCTCCKFTTCSSKNAVCGTASFAESKTAKEKTCNCNISSTNPCEDLSQCAGLKSGSGNECDTGAC
ncbi:MAG: hypothetical protein ACYS9Y_00235 [Planctomycetota bacterium]